jgi:hypothetical protein
LLRNCQQASSPHCWSTLISTSSGLLEPFSQFYFLDSHLHSQVSPSAHRGLIANAVSLLPNRGGVGATGRVCCQVRFFSSLTDTTCVENCPEGYYADEDSHRCVPCHISCRTCEGRHSMQCLSCRSGWFQLGKECLIQCRDR